MRHLSLFTGSGIGDLAAKEAGIETVAQCENDEACCYCLERMWPEAHLFRDVRDVSAKSIRRFGLWPIDIISGGFPCQDISTAGRGAGIEGSRSNLWREMFRVIRQVRPRWVLVENVPAIKVRGIDRVLAPLARIGYACWPCVVGAWAVGAPHKRDRVWIVGRLDNAKSDRKQAAKQQGQRAITLRTSNGLADNQGKCGGRKGDESERGPEGRTAAGRAGKNVGKSTGSGQSWNHNIRDGIGIGTQQQQAEPITADARDAGELADTDCERLQITMCERSDSREEQQTAIGSRWPSRPGEPQHDWEATRLIEFGVGDAVDGLARRVQSRANKAALRMVGNAWCYPVAEIMFQAIAELDSGHPRQPVGLGGEG